MTVELNTQLNNYQYQKAETEKTLETQKTENITLENKIAEAEESGASDEIINDLISEKDVNEYEINETNTSLEDINSSIEEIQKEIEEEAENQRSTMTEWTNQLAINEQNGLPTPDYDVTNGKTRTTENLAEYMEDFRAVAKQEIARSDSNTDGKLSKEELIASEISNSEKVYGKLDDSTKEYFESQLNKTFEYLDINKNNEVELNEYSSFLAATDTNADGKISANEYGYATVFPSFYNTNALQKSLDLNIPLDNAVQMQAASENFRDYMSQYNQVYDNIDTINKSKNNKTN